MNNMTRRDVIKKWFAYLLALGLVSVVNFYAIGPLPIPLPLMLPILSVAGGTLEGPPFGALYGIACGMVQAGLGNQSVGCIFVLSLFGWLAGLTTQYVLRRDVFGHLLCSLAVLAAWDGWAVGIRYWKHVAPVEVLLQVAVPELLCSLAFILPVYWVGLFCCIRYGRIRHE